MKDPIIDEIHKHRDEILKKYGSFQAYHQVVMESQKQYGSRLVSLPTKKKWNHSE